MNPTGDEQFDIDLALLVLTKFPSELLRECLDARFGNVVSSARGCRIEVSCQYLSNIIAWEGCLAI